MKRLVVFCFLICLVTIPNSIASESNKSTLFVIDISGSMKGAKLENTKKAVIQVSDNFDNTQPIGVIAFNQKVIIKLSPTTDHILFKRKVNELQASGETSLFDAVELPLISNLKNSAKQIILIGDGEDTTSKISLKNLISEIKKNQILINAIGVQVTQSQGSVLMKIAEASGGNYYKVDDINLLISTYKTIVQETPKNRTPNKKLVKRKKNNFNLTPVAFGIISSILTSLILFEFRKKTYLKKLQQNRLKSLFQYSSIRAIKSRDILKTFFSTYKFVPNKIKKWIAKELDSVHSNQTYETVIKILLTSWFVLTFFLFIFIKVILISFLLSLPLVCYGFKLYINRIKSKQRLEFDVNLPEMLNLLASALRSGLTLNQGLDAYVMDLENEVSLQIRRANSEIKLGTPIDEALMNVAQRMNSEDLKWAVTALSIQRVVGGSLAGILSTSYDTIKSRAEIRREVRTLSAEGRLSAYVLMALPIAIFLFLLLTRREYAILFFTNPLGVLLLILILILLSVGWRWIKTIVDIKI